MSISPGFTAEEIREFVAEYHRQPHGRKGTWLAAQAVTPARFRRWRETVFEGDLERGLIPREGGPVTTPPGKRTALERQRAREKAEHERQLARLEARVAELEEVNAALGKAIGLLHQMSEQEPDVPPTPSRPSSS
jgi:DNA-binding transcriptional MerR regulator